MIVQKLYSVKDGKLRIISLEGMLHYACLMGVKSKLDPLRYKGRTLLIDYYIAAGDYAAKAGYKKWAADIYMYIEKNNYLNRNSLSTAAIGRIHRKLQKKLLELNTLYALKVYNKLNKEYAYRIYLDRELRSLERRMAKRHEKRKKEN